MIQSAKSFIVDATVDDTEISQVHKGQSVAVTSGRCRDLGDRHRDLGQHGCRPAARASSPSRSSVAVTGHPSGVYAGASATLTITTKKSFKALEIPTLAIHYNGSQATVQVNNGGGAVTRTITVGTSFGLETQVLSGIKAGDKVVVTHPDLRPGYDPRRHRRHRRFGGGFGGGRRLRRRHRRVRRRDGGFGGRPGQAPAGLADEQRRLRMSSDGRQRTVAAAHRRPQDLPHRLDRGRGAARHHPRPSTRATTWRSWARRVRASRP